jgi:dTDP-4-dehydrorhamnose 3,5-epimerase
VGVPPQRDVSIQGVVLFELSTHQDERGSLTETFRRDWIPGARDMVQANVSRSRAGVLRGLHVHRQQADHWMFLSGVAFVALFDLRAGSATEHRKAELRIDGDGSPLGLYIPPAVAHGFYAETDVMLQYLVDRGYTGDDEFGLAWNDPSVGIDWPDPSPRLSDRDLSNPQLGELESFMSSRTPG